MDDVEQLSLPVAAPLTGAPVAPGAAAPTSAAPPASDGAARIERPVARVVLDVPLPHLDRPFDYLVPAALADGAVPGARVSVRFAGREVAGFVVERLARSEHDGALAPLRRVVSRVPPREAREGRAGARGCWHARSPVDADAVGPDSRPE